MRTGALTLAVPGRRNTFEAVMLEANRLTPEQFTLFQQFIYRQTGILRLTARSRF